MSDLVGIPKDRFSQNEAHIAFYTGRGIRIKGMLITSPTCLTMSVYTNVHLLLLLVPNTENNFNIHHYSFFKSYSIFGYKVNVWEDQEL